MSTDRLRLTSFSIESHAACTTLSTSPTLAPLLHSKRAQVAPLLWRTDIDFESEVNESNDSSDEHLRNRFSLDDVEIKGSVPFLRQVVSGLVLDVPFYLSHHKVKMIRAVVVSRGAASPLPQLTLSFGPACRRRPTESIGSSALATLASPPRVRYPSLPTRSAQLSWPTSSPRNRPSSNLSTR